MIVGTGRVACTTANCSGGIAEHTDWVFAPTTMYYQANGTTLIGATTSYGAMPPSFANPISPANSKYWTGLNTDWTSSINNCVNWTSFTGGQFATCGGYLNNNSAAIFTDSWGVSGAPGPVSCIVSGTGLQLLCVEQ
jgi:hypothetical protein